jgi:hypothetical protein
MGKEKYPSQRIKRTIGNQKLIAGIKKPNRIKPNRMIRKVIEETEKVDGSNEEIANKEQTRKNTIFQFKRTII